MLSYIRKGETLSPSAIGRPRAFHPIFFSASAVSDEIYFFSNSAFSMYFSMSIAWYDWKYLSLI
jgi:hypothetical protein